MLKFEFPNIAPINLATKQPAGPVLPTHGLKFLRKFRMIKIWFGS